MSSSLSASPLYPPPPAPSCSELHVHSRYLISLPGNLKSMLYYRFLWDLVWYSLPRNLLLVLLSPILFLTPRTSTFTITAWKPWNLQMSHYKQHGILSLESKNPSCTRQLYPLFTSFHFILLSIRFKVISFHFITISHPDPFPVLETPIYKKAKTPVPTPIIPKETTPTTTLDQANGSGPAPAALFLVLVELLEPVPAAANPLAAFRPVAVGL